MSDEKIDLEKFLEELVSMIEKRLSKQEREISKLRKEVASLKPSGKGRLRVDSSVLRVLRGK
jgi:hypothetical protein